MDKGKLIELMTSLVNSNLETSNFERYDDNDRGIVSLDNTYKLIIERENKQYFIRFNSIKFELTKIEFVELQNKWELAKKNAEKLKLEQQQQKDLILLNNVYGKLGTNS